VDSSKTKGKPIKILPYSLAMVLWRSIFHLPQEAGSRNQHQGCCKAQRSISRTRYGNRSLVSQRQFIYASLQGHTKSQCACSVHLHHEAHFNGFYQLILLQGIMAQFVIHESHEARSPCGSTLQDMPIWLDIRFDIWFALPT